MTVPGLYESVSAPPSWYVHGDFVLDKLCNHVRSQEVNVANAPLGLAPSLVRAAVSVPLGLTMVIDQTMHSVATTLDTVVLLPTGQFFDVQLAVVVDQPSWPVTLELIQPDINFSDLIRVKRTCDAYPEIEMAPPLATKIESDYRYLMGIAEDDADVSTALLSSAPVVSWRRQGRRTD